MLAAWGGDERSFKAWWWGRAAKRRGHPLGTWNTQKTFKKKKHQKTRKNKSVGHLNTWLIVSGEWKPWFFHAFGCHWYLHFEPVWPSVFVVKDLSDGRNMTYIYIGQTVSLDLYWRGTQASQLHSSAPLPGSRNSEISRWKSWRATKVPSTAIAQQREREPTSPSSFPQRFGGPVKHGQPESTPFWGGTWTLKKRNFWAFVGSQRGGAWELWFETSSMFENLCTHRGPTWPRFGYELDGFNCICPIQSPRVQDLGIFWGHFWHVMFVWLLEGQIRTYRVWSLSLQSLMQLLHGPKVQAPPRRTPASDLCRRMLLSNFRKKASRKEITRHVAGFKKLNSKYPEIKWVLLAVKMCSTNKYDQPNHVRALLV